MTAPDPVRKTIAGALLALPAVFALVFVLHFRHLADFLTFSLSYTPRAPERVAASFIAAQNRWPMLHDPHMIAYLTLPLFQLAAAGLYVLGKNTRPLASALTLAVTSCGTIYLGGLFGMWTAFYRGLGYVDPSQTAGAAATFAAMSSNRGAFLLTTTLAKIPFVGLAAQALGLLGAGRRVPIWSVASVVVGCALFLAFWDLDNWMLLGSILLFVGFVPMRRAILDPSVAPAQTP